MQRLAFISDTRIAAGGTEPAPAWERAAERVAWLQPAATVHLGPITRDGADRPASVQLAADLLKAWPTPVHSLPGAQDLGGNARGPAPGALMRFRRQIGADRWAVPLGRWLLVGMNTRLFGSGSECEAEQWDWLDRLAAADTRRNLLLCLTLPLPRTPLEGLSEPDAHLSPEVSERLLGGVFGRRLAAVCAAGLSEAQAHHGFRVDRLAAGDGLRAIDQLVIGDPSRGLGWMTLDDSAVELGYVILDRSPAGPAEPVLRRDDVTVCAA